jgi:hypothetical protein
VAEPVVDQYLALTLFSIVLMENESCDKVSVIFNKISHLWNKRRRHYVDAWIELCVKGCKRQQATHILSGCVIEMLTSLWLKGDVETLLAYPLISGIAGQVSFLIGYP